MEKCFECPRCCGKGHIAAYSNVQGGVCFRCAGTGKVATRPQIGTKWECVYAGVSLFTIKARSEAAALRAAVARINPAYPAFKGVTPDQVEVRPAAW